MKPGFYQLSAAEYHADPCDTPSLSSSVAKVLVHQSPFHAWLKHPKLGNAARESTPEQNRGTLIHALVLGTGLEQIVTVAADNYRTKVAQDCRDAALEAGKTPILAREMDDAQATADAIREAVGSATGCDLRRGTREEVVVWEEDTPSGKVLCRGMIDWLNLGDNDGLILDVKTCQSAHPKACTSHVLTYGYDVQHAAYTSAVGTLRPDLAGRVDYAWLFVEIVPPPRRVILTVARPDGAMQELGRARWSRACATWARCLASGQWPAYGEARLEAPAWAVKEELEGEYPTA